ncbi:MAG: SusD/RagB family nutrient-binding outer membrane lipoprotein [Chitinophagaceae bacterium]|nr:SusD/RagB family nutrient-binding outer membrane lipoprotein [Chitinophagaceae bacterium]MCW5926964.1 SusD/RagB family nutrient-binding outer membrane lipoprotein [Chitinophagaceae bacterium]
MKSKVLFYILLVSVIFTSCEKFLDVNDNPNLPGSATLPLSAKLPAAQVSTAIQETGQLNQIGAFWGGYWGTNNEAINQFIDLKSYNGPAIRHQRDGIPVWENGYTNLLYYQLIREEAEQKNELFYAGVAKIMMGWHFLRLVDIYNGIPFDQALLGSNHISPEYEDGKTVYQKSVELISAGIEDIKNAPASSTIDPGTNDVMFKGDKTRWIKFGNTVKLRALIRQSEAGEQSYISTELAKIQGEGSGFLTAGQNATVNPGYADANPNSFWNGYYKDPTGASTANRENIRPTVFVLDQYKQLNDPRISNLYTDIAGEYNGVLFGNPVAAPEYARDATSAFKGPGENGGLPAALFKSPGQALVLMGSFESLFLQAEAAQRGWLSGADAKSLYEQAIRESFKYMEVPDAEFAAYNAQATVNFDEATDKIERIITQKWLSLNSISSIEAWNDYRRLGIPQIPNSLEAPSPTSRPLRFMYPETERMTNNEQTLKMGSDDILNNKVWWDK